MSRGIWIARWRDELIAGLASGFLLAMCFPPFPTRFLAAIALVPVFLYYLRKSHGAFPGGGHRAGADCGSSNGIDAGAATHAPLRARLKHGFILGFVLGDLAEVYLYTATSRYGASWLLRPGVVILFVVAVFIAFYPHLKEKRFRRKETAHETER